MSAPNAVVTGLCFRCGGPVAEGQPTCPYCGMPVISPAGAGPLPAGPPAVRSTAPAAALSPVVPAYIGGPALTLGPAPRRGTGRRALAAALLVLVVLAGGGAAAIAARLRDSGAPGAVHDYFAALAAGDATRALRYVRVSGQFSAADFPLLSNAALADRAYRPSGVHIGAISPIQGAPSGIEATSTTVTYRAAGQTVQMPVVIVRSGGVYQLQEPFVELAVQNAGGRQVSVNGVALDDQVAGTVAFPGAFHAVAAGNALLAGSQASAVPQLAGNALSAAQPDLGVPALADGALGAIQQAARGELDTCSASTLPVPDGCPFGLNVPGTAATVHWSITTYPAISAAVTQGLLGGVGVAVGDDHTGKVHWDINYTGYAGDKRHEAGDLAFTVNGSAQPNGSGIQVSLVG